MALLKGFEPPPRPVATNKTYMAAAKKVAEELNWDDVEIDEIAADIVEVTVLDRTMDGYRIARLLEDNGYDGIDLDAANTLDNFGFYVSKELDVEEAFWVKDNDIQPKLKAGDSVTWMSRHERKFGKITGIFEHGAAEYLIQECNKEGLRIKDNRELVVKFENVTKWKPKRIEGSENDNSQID